ncbi:MAG: site-specific DNA-methyltransferase [Actinomycetota bacterium]
MPELHWCGKEAVLNHHRQVPVHPLAPRPARSVGSPDAPNLVVEGDNLLALQALLPAYRGAVKCIYIDPPYNTGHGEWIYNDRVDAPVIREWLGQAVGKHLAESTRQDRWLCMMYPRLRLLREFLHEEGLLFVSIDDNAAHHLRLVLDEILGAENWMATLTRRAMHTVRNTSKDFNHNVDYVLVYARNKAWHGASRNRYIRVPADRGGTYRYDDGDGKGPYKLDPIHARNYYQPYEFTFSNGMVWSAPEGRYPVYSPARLAELAAAGEIGFRGRTPQVKRYLQRVQPGQPPDALLDPAVVGFNSHATTMLRRILGRKAFPQPKPVALLNFLVSLVQDPNSIVLDSFAGSGTTGHAVLAANHADGGSRSFILVEMEPRICREVTAERLKRVIAGYCYKDTLGVEHRVDGLGGSFRYLRVGSAPTERPASVSSP